MSESFAIRFVAATSSDPFVTDFSTTSKPYSAASFFRLFTSDTEFASDEL